MQPIAVKSRPLEQGHAYAGRFDYVTRQTTTRGVGLGVRRATQPDRFPPPRRWRGRRRSHRAGRLRTDDRERGVRPDFQLPAGAGTILIAAVRAANKNTSSRFISGGGVEMTRWLDRVPAIGRPGTRAREGGRALAQ